MPPDAIRSCPPPPVAFRMALHATLHEAHDAVLHEPIPKELLIAAGEGSAGWDELRAEWGAGPGDRE